METIYKIEIKNQYVYNCMKRSKITKDWRWATDDSLSGWSPYWIGNLRGCDKIVLFVHSDGTVTYSSYKRHPEDFADAVPWAQWCKILNERRNKIEDGKDHAPTDQVHA